MRKNDIKKQQLKAYLSSDDELQFDLELDPDYHTERSRPAVPPVSRIIQPRHPWLQETIYEAEEPKIQIGKPESRSQEQALTIASNFYPNLEIPDSFWDSPAPSPKRGRFRYIIDDEGYSDFPTFAKKVLYPELQDLTYFRDDSNYSSPDQDSERESSVIQLNYKMLLKLFDVVENMQLYADYMIELNQAHANNDFFKACEQFIEKYDEVFQKTVSRGCHPNAIAEEFYQVFKIDALIETFVQTLKKTLIDMGDSGDLEHHGLFDSSPLPLTPLDDRYFLSLYGIHTSPCREGALLVCDEPYAGTPEDNTVSTIRRGSRSL